MKYIQTNVFGDNIIYSISPDFTRDLNSDLELEILSILKELDVDSISIRYEHSSETVQFVSIIEQFLIKNDYLVYKNGVTQSEIQRNEFSIQRHPSDPNFAKITIGTLL